MAVRRVAGAGELRDWDLHATSLLAELQASLFHEGQGGCLYTWGGVNESLYGSEKRDSNKGCLGHGDADIYAGQLLPTRCDSRVQVAGVARRAVAFLRCELSQCRHSPRDGLTLGRSWCRHSL